jgi:hypothetical protein
MTLPNFLVIGAGRSGTTSLHHYLGQHPDVFLPSVKSPSHFFCCDLPPVKDRYLRALTRHYFVPDPRDYEALFDGVRGETAVGEVSPVYLATVHAAPRIASRLPHARLIAILRHPVDRAYARFVGRRRDGLEPRSDFRQIVREELEEPLVRDDAFGSYIASGCCHHFLKSYFDRFPRDCMRIHLFEDFARDPAAVMADLFEFLHVDPGFVPVIERRHNRSGGLIRNPVLRLVWTRSALVRAALGPHVLQSLRDAAFRIFASDLVMPALDPELRAELTELFRADIEKLQDLLGRDLSHWLAQAG